PRTTRHQHRPPRPPGRGVVVGGGVFEATAEDAGRPDRDLVLLPDAGQHGDETAGGAAVDGRGEVDEAAPTRGDLQCGNPTEPPHGALYGIGRAIGPAHRHPAPRRGPQRRRHPGIAERLNEGESGGDGRRSAVVRAVGEGEQRHHARDGPDGGKKRREVATVGAALVGQALDLGAVGDECVGHRASPGGLGGLGGLDHQPASGEGGGGGDGGAGEGVPGDAVAQGLQVCLFPAPAVP
ncbi:hypothetical protein GA0115233_11731, partial [Streptomyces sp. DI166]